MKKAAPKTKKKPGKKKPKAKIVYPPEPSIQVTSEDLMNDYHTQFGEAVKQVSILRLRVERYTAFAAYWKERALKSEEDKDGS